MHEQSIVESFLNLSLDHARKAEANRILKIYLVVGELSGVVDEAVEFYFRFLSKNTIAAEAVIDFRHIPARCRCRKCDYIFQPENYDYHCPKCKGQQIEIVSGRELFIDRLEVD
jgi:hydrogenase nickel incorporation protein HypA/HybF